MFERWRALRDRWFADPRFRRRIAKLPMGGRIADRHALRLFGIVSGFAQSQMLAAAVASGLIDLLRAGPVARSLVTARLALPTDSVDALLQATQALGLIELRGEAIGLTIDGLVIATDPGIRAMIAHDRLLYRDLADPMAVLRSPGSGALAAFWPYAGQAGDAQGYSALMAASQGFVADAVIAAVDFARFPRIVDVGGGDGSFLAAVARAAPRSRLALVETAAVAAIARDRLAERGLADRIAVESRGATLPDADAVTLVRVLHDRDDDAALALLKDAAAALSPGGRVVIAEPLARPGIDPQSVYFAAYFRAMGSGRLRTRRQIDALLVAAGLRRRRSTTSLLATVIQAGHSRA